MRYANVQLLETDAFKRLVGIPPVLFHELLGTLEQAERTKRKSGRPSPLSLADQLLLTLGYWREYRTLFHQQVAFNRVFAHFRVKVEHCIRLLKIFRILKERYRNRRRRFGIRLQLITGCVNWMLQQRRE